MKTLKKKLKRPASATNKLIVGWREWCALPEFGIDEIKCKVDTGAKTSCLHAYDVKVLKRHGREVVFFKVHPLQKNTRKVIYCEGYFLEWRGVTDSGGKRTLRPVVKTWLNLGGILKEIELTLVARDEMGFRMLLGREALQGTWVVDPSKSFLQTLVSKKSLRR